MGVSIVYPSINGISDYRNAPVDHAILGIDRYNSITNFNVYFKLPEFATLPEIYLRQVTADIIIIFKGIEFSLA
jgi:hypothetical protein